MENENMNYNLDSASTIFALGRKEGRGYNIRLSISLYEEIKKDILEKALKETMKKYPYFFVRFIKNKNDLIAEIIKGKQRVEEKTDLSSLSFQDACGDCEALISYNDKNIVFEYSHAISDAKGGIHFLLSLVIDYLHLRYNDEKIINSIEHIPISEQLEDGYKVHSKGFNTIQRKGAAYKFKGTPELGNLINVNSYYLSTEEIKKLAKEYEVSLNALIVGLMSMAVLRVQKEGNHSLKKKVRINVPVNLRARFKSNTLRNFILNVYPEIKPKKEDMGLLEISKKIHEYVKKHTDIELLAGRCASSNKIFDTNFIKMVPLSIKKAFIQLGFNIHSRSTMTFSNIGIIPFDEEMDKYISDFEVIFSAKPGAPYSGTITSFKDITKITLLRTIKESLLEDKFKEVLKEVEINYKTTLS